MSLVNSAKSYLLSHSDYRHSIEKAFFKDGQEIFLSGKFNGDSLKIDPIYYSNILNKSLDEFKKTNLYNLGVLLDVKNTVVFDHMNITVPDINKLSSFNIMSDYVIEYVDNCYDRILKLISNRESLNTKNFAVPDVTTEVYSVIKNTLRSSGVLSSYNPNEIVNAKFDEAPMSAAYFIQYVKPFMNNIKQNRDNEIIKISKVVEAVDYAESFIRKIYERIHSTVVNNNFNRVEYSNLLKYTYVHIGGLLDIMSKISFIAVHELCKYDSLFSKINQISVYVANTMGTNANESTNIDAIMDGLQEYHSNPFENEIKHLIREYDLVDGYRPIDDKELRIIYNNMVYPFLRIRDMFRALDTNDIENPDFTAEYVDQTLKSFRLDEIKSELSMAHAALYEKSENVENLAGCDLYTFNCVISKLSDAMNEINTLHTAMLNKIASSDIANTILGEEITNYLKDYKANVLEVGYHDVSVILVDIFSRISDTLTRSKEYTGESFDTDTTDYLGLALDFEYECVKFDHSEEFRRMENEFFIAKESVINGINVVILEADGQQQNQGNTDNNGEQQQATANQNNNQQNKPVAEINTDNTQNNNNQNNDGSNNGKNIFQRAIDFIKGIVNKFVEFITGKNPGNKKFFDAVKPDVENMTDAQKKGLVINTLPYNQYPYTNIKSNIDKTKTIVGSFKEGLILKDKKTMYKKLFPYLGGGANKIEDDDALAKYFTNYNKIGPKAGAGDPQYIKLTGMEAYNFLVSEVIPYCDVYTNNNYPKTIGDALNELVKTISDKGVQEPKLGKGVNMEALNTVLNKFSGATINAVRDRYQDHMTLLKNISGQIKNNSKIGESSGNENQENENQNNNNNDTTENK